MAKTAWGIEAGTSSVKAVKLSVDGRGAVTLEDVSMISLANFRASGATDQGALLGALREFVIDKSIRPSDICYVSLPGRNAFSRVVSLPPVSDDKIRETIANEARGQIPIKLEEAVWDYQRITSDSGEVEVNLYAVKRDVVDTLMRTCSQAGLTIRGIQLAPLGIYNFVKHELDETISNGCVCIDIGAENSDLVVVDGEKAWLRVVPTAGNDVTKALIMRDQRLNPQTAEALKRNPAGVVKKLNSEKKDPKWPDVAHVLEAMKAPLRELVADIHRSVGFYKNQNPEAQTEHLVMMGNGSRLINLDKFLRQQLQFDVTRVSSLSSITIGRGLDPAQITDLVPSLVVPIGLALQACGVAGVSKTNLVPEDLIVQEQLSRTRPMAVLGGALVALFGIAALLIGMSPRGTADQKLDSLKALNSKVQASNAEWAKELARGPELLARATTLNNLKRGEDLVPIVGQVVQGLVTDFEKANNVSFFRALSQDGKRSGVEVAEKSGKLEPLGGKPKAKGAVGPQAYIRTTVVEAFSSFAIELPPLDSSGGPTSTKPLDEPGKVAQSFFKHCAKVLYLTLQAKSNEDAVRSSLTELKLSEGLIGNLLNLRVHLKKIDAVSEEAGIEIVRMTMLHKSPEGTQGTRPITYGEAFGVGGGTANQNSKRLLYYQFQVLMDFESSPWMP